MEDDLDLNLEDLNLEDLNLEESYNDLDFK